MVTGSVILEDAIPKNNKLAVAARVAVNPFMVNSNMNQRGKWDATEYNECVGIVNEGWIAPEWVKSYRRVLGTGRRY